MSTGKFGNLSSSKKSHYLKGSAPSNFVSSRSRPTLKMPTTTTVRSSRAGQARTRNTNALPSVGVGYGRVPRTARTLKKNGMRPDLRVRSEASKPPLRLIQHKHEAWWFYRYLSQVYDHIVNPGHWTESMREDALKPARLNEKQRVVDVGGGTGFSTTGVVAAGVKPTNITLVDQSPHQLEKARKKPQLQGCTIMEGDAENLDFPTNEFDRYVSCGSIEYWPDPQRGIAEAYRVVEAWWFSLHGGTRSPDALA